LACQYLVDRLERNSFVEPILHACEPDSTDLGSSDHAKQVDLIEGARGFGKRKAQSLA